MRRRLRCFALMWPLVHLFLLSNPCSAESPPAFYHLDRIVGPEAAPRLPFERPADKEQFVWPTGIAVDSRGDVIVADHRFAYRIANGKAIRITETGTFQCQGMVGHEFIYSPWPGGAGNCWARGMVAEPDGNILLAHSGFYQVWRMNGAGGRSVIAGGGTQSSWGGNSGDNGPALQARLNSPGGVARDSQNNIYIADTGNHVIRKISPSGIITRIAGTASAGSGPAAGAAATATPLHYPFGVAVDVAGNIYVANTFANNVIRITPGGQAWLFAGGSGAQSSDNDQIPATTARLTRPVAVAVSPSGEVYIAEANRIRKVRDGIISTVAGGPTAGDAGDGGPATQARLSFPNGIAFDAAGNLYVADTGNNLVRKIDSKGVITTLAGQRSLEEGISALEAEFPELGGSAIGPDGGLYLTDVLRSSVYRIAPDGRL